LAIFAAIRLVFGENGWQLPNKKQAY